MKGSQFQKESVTLVRVNRGSIRFSDMAWDSSAIRFQPVFLVKRRQSRDDAAGREICYQIVRPPSRASGLRASWLVHDGLAQILIVALITNQ